MHTSIDHGEEAYMQALPLFERLLSHLLWMGGWFVLAIGSHFLFSFSWLLWLEYISMSLVFFHLFVGGCRLTQLLLVGGLKKILFPSPTERIIRRLCKGAGREYLERCQLDEHVDLLTHLALIEFTRRNRDKARWASEKALKLAPADPSLLALHARISVDS